MKKNEHAGDTAVTSIEIRREGGRFGVATLGQTIDNGWHSERSVVPLKRYGFHKFTSSILRAQL